MKEDFIGYCPHCDCESELVYYLERVECSSRVLTIEEGFICEKCKIHFMVFNRNDCRESSRIAPEEFRKLEKMLRIK